MDEINDAAYEATKAQYVPCDNCGRRFAADRIQVHQRSCKPGHAAKSVGVCFILFYYFLYYFMLRRPLVVDEWLTDPFNSERMLLMV